MLGRSTSKFEPQTIRNRETNLIRPKVAVDMVHIDNAAYTYNKCVLGISLRVDIHVSGYTTSMEEISI